MVIIKLVEFIIFCLCPCSLANTCQNAKERKIIDSALTIEVFKQTETFSFNYFIDSLFSRLVTSQFFRPT